MLTICKHTGLKGKSFPLQLVNYAHTLWLLNHKIVVTEAPVNGSRNHNVSKKQLLPTFLIYQKSLQHNIHVNISIKTIKKQKIIVYSSSACFSKKKKYIYIYSSSPTSSTFIFVTYFLKNQSLKRAQISYYVANQRPLNVTM